MNVTHTGQGWKIETAATLSDEEAGAVTFIVEPKQAVLGEFVEVVDAEGIRIGEVTRATLQRRAFAPSIAVVEIALL